MEPGPRLYLELIGGFRAVLNGRAVPAEAWPGRRSRELVQLLALSDGFALTKDQVMEALWGHLAPTAAAANLRKAAHHARKALGLPEAVVLRQGMVNLLPGGEIVTDLHQFERSAEVAVSTNDIDSCRRLLDRFKGELLTSARYEEWVDPPRRRLEGMRKALMRAARMWPELIALDPLDETSYREAMQAALDAGNRALAIQFYGRLRTTLTTELSVAPSTETEALYRACLAGVSTEPPIFVGRDIPLATGMAAIESSVGRRRCLAIRGDPGLGKTRLAGELARRAVEDGWTTFQVSCPPTSSAYGLWIGCVGEIRRVQSVPPATEQIISGLSRDEVSGLQLGRHRVIGALETLLSLVTEDVGKTLIILDDVHFADEASVDVLVRLLATAPPADLFVITTYEPGSALTSLTRGLSRLDRMGRSVTIDLEPLGWAETRALARSTAPTASDEALDWLCRLAEGNPSVALELAAAVGTDGSLNIPPTTWESALTCTQVLDEAEVAVLERLAVVDMPMTSDQIRVIVDLDEAETHRLLDHAIDIGVLAVEQGRYRFSRELTRRALTERVPPHRREAINRDVARRLAASGQADPERIAHHWIEGGRPAMARPWLLSGARRAMASGAFVNSLQMADIVLSSSATDPEALLVRADSLAALGRPDSVAAYVRAIPYLDEQQSHDVKAKLALTQLKTGDPTGALNTLATSRPTTLQGRIWEALTLSGAAAIGYGEAHLAAEKAAQARELAMEAGDSGALVEASWALSLAAHARGDLPSTLRSGLALTTGREELAIRVFDGYLCATERLLYGTHPYDALIDFAESLRTESARMDARRGQAFALTLSGAARLLSGRLDEAAADLEAATDINRSVGATAGEALALQRRAEVEVYRGDLPRAQAILTTALSVARDSYLGEHLFDRIYGTLIMATEDQYRPALIEEAEEAVAGPSETCPACRITLEVPAAIAAARAGDIPRVRRHTQAVDMLAKVMVPQPGWKAAAEEVHGHLSRIEGDESAAKEHFRLAAEIFRSAGQPLDVSRCESHIQG